ncbi:hypothetical protein SBOR_0443 [Sclerotinia borealis F-4128]|uniref:Uncharacterized protein n=1 Tax=Sclerotinia borealis (strain F-4128) TaxID=1432307 RepID=W9CWY2_SCLBF|nr:hypothetical protein SBOR_0443 [Sclerotinia borealis F-4128]
MQVLLGFRLVLGFSPQVVDRSFRQARLQAFLVIPQDSSNQEPDDMPMISEHFHPVLSLHDEHFESVTDEFLGDGSGGGFWKEDKICPELCGDPEAALANRVVVLRNCSASHRGGPVGILFRIVSLAAIDDCSVLVFHSAAYIREAIDKADLAIGYEVAFMTSIDAPESNDKANPCWIKALPRTLKFIELREGS